VRARQTGTYTRGMRSPASRRFAAGVLSMLVPGAGQLYLGAKRRGLVLLGLTAVLLFGLLVVVERAQVESIDRRLVVAVLAVDVALLALRLFAVLDAWRGGVAGVAVLVALTAAPHVAAGWVTVRSYDVLDSVFADEEPCGTACDRGSVLLAHVVVPLPEWVPKDAWEWALVERLGPGEVAPLEADARVVSDTQSATSKPWTTILLLGTDEGPGNWGARTDTIILAAVQHGTGRAAAFGVPRNLAQVPLGKKGRPSKEPLNAIFGLNGGGEQGAAALKQAVSNLLAIRVDYYALVNLVGFADLVDALGGVEILVKERLRDEVTRPAWGEPKPTIDVLPGRTYRFYGREALAYVRSRKDSSDYTRMARQRCFLSAMADQLDPVRAIRNFGSLAKTIETNVRTDIPLNRLPPLVRLVSSVDSHETLTVTFGFDYFFGRQKAGNYPVPALGRIRSTVRRAILTPELLKQTGKAKTAEQAC
jgi:polyisoprenyl-teichoic acid--peptidoglycan teichoic acid transferase